MNKIMRNLPDLKSSIMGVFTTILIVAIIVYVQYLRQEPLSWHDAGSWWNVCICLTVKAFIDMVICACEDRNDSPLWHMSWIICAILWLLFLGLGIISSDGVNAKRLYEKVSEKVSVIESSSEESVFPNLLGDSNDVSNLPLIGIPEALKKSETEIGKFVALGSRFMVNESSMTTQNINGKLYYVAPLEPKDFMKWNSEEGSLGYFVIDRNNGETTFVETPLLTTEKAPFGDSAKRIIYDYLDEMNIDGRVTDISPEVNDDGEFFFVATIYKIHKMDEFKEVIGVVELNANTKQCNYYPIGEIPDYIDRVYPESFFESYIKYYGKYSNGWWNSFTTKDGVLVPTSDLEVIYIDGTCYYYTGMTTSLVGDASNGIIMMNSRSGEMKYYQTHGVSEKKAREVAEGKVADMGYVAGYPLLLMVGNYETYFMLMRDSHDNLCGYAFVNYKDSQKVGYGETVIQAQEAYLQSCATKITGDTLSNEDLISINGIIENIASEVINGTTTYYVKLVGSDMTFVFNSTLDFNIVFAKIGDGIEIFYTNTTSKLIPAVKVIVR